MGTIEEIKLLREFVKDLSELPASGGDPYEECVMCRGEIQYAAKQLLAGLSNLQGDSNGKCK